MHAAYLSKKTHNNQLKKLCYNLPNCAPVALPCPNVLLRCGGGFDFAASAKRLDAIEEQLAKPDAWNDPSALTPVLQEKSRLNAEAERLGRLSACHANMEEWLQFAEEDEEALNVLA